MKAEENSEKNESVLKCRQELLDRFAMLEQRRLDIKANRLARVELNGILDPDGNDELELNVGGMHVSTRRSVLISFPNSKLAMMFSGRWDKRLQRDKNNKIFLDLDPSCFRIILDYLIQCQQMPVVTDDTYRFLCPLPQVPDDLTSTFEQTCLFLNIVQIKTSFDTPPHDVRYKHSQRLYDDHDFDTEDNIGGGNVGGGGGGGGGGDLVFDSDDSAAELQLVLAEEEQIELDAMEHDRLFAREEQFILSFAAGETKDVVELDVRGEGVAVRRSTLRLLRGSVPHLQFDDVSWRQGSKRKIGSVNDDDDEEEEEEEDDAGDAGRSVFIDADPYVFGKVVSQLRLGAMWPRELDKMRLPRPRVAVPHLASFRALVHYLFPGQEEMFRPAVNYFPSTKVVADEAHQVVLYGWLEEALRVQRGATAEEQDTRPPTSGACCCCCHLLYQGSRDGFSAAEFHAKCDNKCATVTLIKSVTGHIFGGYSDQSWDSDSGYKPSSAAFLFSLLSPGTGRAPVQLPLSGANDGEAVCCDAACGPSFGGRADLHVELETRVYTESRTTLGHSFATPPHTKANSFLSGSWEFFLEEIEVYAVQYYHAPRAAGVGAAARYCECN